MREGKPSPRFGARGLHTIQLGGGSIPLLLKLYDKQDNVIATLTEEKGECIDPGYVDFFHRRIGWLQCGEACRVGKSTSRHVRFYHRKCL